MFNDLSLDPSLFEAEDDDYQFEIYRLMKQSNGSVAWQFFNPSVLHRYFFSTVKEREPKRNKEHSILIRILNNYFYELLMIISLDLNWPDDVLRFFQKIAIINDANKTILKVYCFF